MDKLKFYICSTCKNIQVITEGENFLECCLSKPEILEPIDLDSEIIRIEKIDNNKIITANYMQDEEDYITFMCFVYGEEMVLDYFFPYDETKLIVPNKKGTLYIHINEKGLFRKEIGSNI